MRIITGNLSAVYSGRGDSYLAPYNRVVLLKDDSSIGIHTENGYKPMNYMMAPTTLDETFENDELTWTITGKNETLIITFHEVFTDNKIVLGTNDPGLIRESTEHHLQAWLASNITQVFGQEYSLVKREFETGFGPVDLLLSKGNDTLVAVEVKRSAPMNTVGQVLRYVDALEESHPTKKIEAIIAAVEFSSSTFTIAEKKNVTCIQVGNEWRDKTIESNPLSGTIFDID